MKSSKRHFHCWETITADVSRPANAPAGCFLSNKGLSLFLLTFASVKSSVKFQDRKMTATPSSFTKPQILVWT